MVYNFTFPALLPVQNVCTYNYDGVWTCTYGVDSIIDYADMNGNEKVIHIRIYVHTYTYNVQR